MAARKKKRCPGQFGPGGKRVKRGTCAKTRCKGQMAGSTRGGRPKRRKTTVCLKPKRRAATKRKRAHKTKGVMSHGRRVWGAAATAVKRKRARKGSAKPRRRSVRGTAGMSIGGAHRAHRHHGGVAIIKTDTGAVIGHGYTVAEAVRHVKKKRRRSSSARAGSLGRF